MVHKYGNVVNILSHPDAKFSSGISNERGIMLCLSIFHYAFYFFVSVRMCFFSVNNLKAFRGSRETWDEEENKSKMSKKSAKGEKIINRQTNFHLEGSLAGAAQRLSVP